MRIALNYALDMEGFFQLRGGPLFGELAGHIMVNSLQGDQLKDYDPYPSPNGRGDVTFGQIGHGRVRVRHGR